MSELRCRSNAASRVIERRRMIGLNVTENGFPVGADRGHLRRAGATNRRPGVLPRSGSRLTTSCAPPRKQRRINENETAQGNYPGCRGNVEHRFSQDVEGGHDSR